MQDNSTRQAGSSVTRRQFMGASAAAGAAFLAAGRHAHAAGSDTIRVGLIGCGGRGTGAGIIDCANAAPGVELVAMGDLFQDHLEAAPARIKGNLTRRKVSPKDVYKVTPDTTFCGWDAYKKVIACDVDMVILTTPPYFRPAHFKAAVEAGKHVFVEKPIATDPVHVRDFIATAELAENKGLTVVAGTQMRRARHIMAAMQRMHDGALGDLTGGQCVRRSGGMLDWYGDTKEQKPAWSDMEWQIRRWLFFTWLSGDFITEMHVHNLDLVNWAMGSHPIQCTASGGRQVRTGPEYGDVYDHFSAEYIYPNGARVLYMGGQIDGISGRNDQRFVGTKGEAYVDFGQSTITAGGNKWTYEGESVQPHVQEYADMIASIRDGAPINEGRQVAESTLTAIMGRLSAYTARALKWDWLMNASKLDLSPPEEAFCALPEPQAAMPGQTKLI